MKYELAEPDKYYTAQVNMKTGEKFFQEENYAEPVVINDLPLDLFGCQGINDYTISDGATGRKMTGGDTKAEAVAKAKKLIKKYGLDGVLESRERGIEAFDISPRYREVK